MTNLYAKLTWNPQANQMLFLNIQCLAYPDFLEIDTLDVLP